MVVCFFCDEAVEVYAWAFVPFESTDPTVRHDPVPVICCSECKHNHLARKPAEVTPDGHWKVG